MVEDCQRYCYCRNRVIFIQSEDKIYLQTRDGTGYLYYTRDRNHAQECCRTAVRNFEKKIARNATQNPKAFFMYARSKLKTKEGVGDLSDGANKVSYDEGKANLLNKF